ncbi:MAG: hypothetical protein MUC83_11635 [Pirellula sp.]|nr:hypothetical protein [Pirellula sp.]
MRNPDRSLDPKIFATTDANTRAWPAYWLLSLIAPFVLLSAVMVVLGDQKIDGVTTLVLIVLPFICGFVGSMWAVKRASLTGVQSVLLLLATLAAYGIGFVVFLILSISLFGVIATWWYVSRSCGCLVSSPAVLVTHRY